MGHGIILVLVIAASVFSLLSLVGPNSLNAQNVTNMTTGTNATVGNMTGGSTHISTARMQIEEGIKALQAGDNNSARTHLDAAHHELELVFETTAGGSSNATKQFEEGMEALQTGDTNGAITRFTAADQALG